MALRAALPLARRTTRNKPNVTQTLNKITVILGGYHSSETHGTPYRTPATTWRKTVIETNLIHVSS